jgi:flagellar hook assembly protein FlgD
MIGYSNERKGMKNYGLGFRIYQFDNGKKITYHNGWWHGNNTTFVHLPDEKITIIALGNKKSRHVYSAYSLAGLFGDYGVSLATDENEMKNNIDSLTVNLNQKIENYNNRNIKTFAKNSNEKDTIIH